MVENPQTGALENFGLERFTQLFPELNRQPYNIDYLTLEHPIDSSDMEPKTGWR